MKNKDSIEHGGGNYRSGTETQETAKAHPGSTEGGGLGISDAT